MDNKTFSEYIYSRFLWTRTNTIELFQLAEKSGILMYKPHYLLENPTENHNLLYQFQCILTSANTHFRRLRNDVNKSFGVYIKHASVTKKQEIQSKDIVSLLNEQLEEAKLLLRNQVDVKQVVSTFITIGEHETLHQGQLVVMFRETKVDFPAEFKDAWNL